MVYAFIDDSGHFNDSEYVVLAGYILDEETYTNFDKRWTQILRKYGIRAIHMKDLMSLQGEYKDLSWKLQDRDKVLEECILAIKDYGIMGLAVAVNVKDFRSLPKSGQQFLGKDPLYLCVRLMIDLIKKHNQGQRVFLTFDDSDEYSVNVLRLIIKVRKYEPEIRQIITCINFADDIAFAPIQAADVLAWLTHKDLGQKVGGFSRQSTFISLTTLTEPIGLTYDGYLCDKEYLDKLNKLGQS